MAGGRGVTHYHQPANGKELRPDSTSCTLKEKKEKKEKEQKEQKEPLPRSGVQTSPPTSLLAAVLS